MSEEWDECVQDYENEKLQPQPPFPDDFPDWWDPDEDNRSRSSSGKYTEKKHDPDHSSIEITGFKPFPGGFFLNEDL